MPESETVRILSFVSWTSTAHVTRFQPFPIPVVANLRVADATKDMAFYLRTLLKLLSVGCAVECRVPGRPARSGVNSCLTELGDISFSLVRNPPAIASRERSPGRATDGPHNAPIRSRNTATASARRCTFAFASASTSRIRTP